MTFQDIQNQVVAITNVTQQTDLVKKSINIALSRIAEYFEWPYYMVSSGLISTVATYSTGTVTATNGSATVTGSGTVWTSAMIGRKIRVASGQPYYVIKSVGSTTSIILATVFQETTATGATYTIYKDEYRLAADVDTYKTIIQIQNATAMDSVPPARFDKFFPSPYSYAHPIMEIMKGTNLDTYSTGTITVTVNSTIIVGVGTGWNSVEGLGRMSIITVGSNVYTVKSVTDDTNLVIFEVPSVAAATSVYSIGLTNLLVQVYPIPSQQENLYYRYYRIPSLLINSYDVPDMPPQFQYLLIYGSMSFVFLSKGDVSKSQIESENRFLMGLQDMKKKLGSYASDRVWKVSPQDLYISYGEGLEKSTFDRRYSA